MKTEKQSETTKSHSKGGATWVASDPHFGHSNICKFTDNEGQPIRPWDDVYEMDYVLVDNWNSVVQPGDRVYLLGDVAFSPRTMREVIPALNGRICLVPGNHEPPKMRKYFDLFDDVRGYVQNKGFIMSHIPLHPDCLGRWNFNIHGHLHHNIVKTVDGQPDSRYFNVSMERINYTPILLDEVLKAKPCT